MKSNKQIWDEHTDDITDIDEVDYAGIRAIREGKLEAIEYFYLRLLKGTTTSELNENILKSLKYEVLKTIEDEMV